MEIPSQLAESIGVALDEARLLGLEVDASRRLGGATFQVLTLPEAGAAPDDCRIQMLFLDVGRCAVSLPAPSSTDDTFEPRPIELRDLLPSVQRYGGLPIYGWKFINEPPVETESWHNRLSLDWRDVRGSTKNCISLFQGVLPPYLEIWLWFESLQTTRPDGSEVTLDDFCLGGRRWWKALATGDPRASGYDIHTMPPRDA